MSDQERKDFESKLERYWSLAYQEGKTGESRGSEANEVLAQLRAAIAQQAVEAGASEETQRFAIEVEKMLCEKLGRKWAPAGMSIQTLIDDLAAAPAAPQASNWIAADDVQRLTRELDVLLNGEAGAAQQASLCDLVAQVRAAKQAAPQAEQQAAADTDLMAQIAAMDATIAEQHKQLNQFRTTVVELRAALAAQQTEREPQGEVVGWLYEGIAPHTKGERVLKTERASDLETRWWREIGPVYIGRAHGIGHHVPGQGSEQ